MEELSIEPTDSTPEIKYHSDKKILEFSGSSYSEDPVEFYKPVIEWMRDFLITHTDSFSVKFRIEYLNTSSIRNFVKIFKILEKFRVAGNSLSVEWVYDPENEIAMDYADFFQELIKLPFHLIEEKQV